ncbi:hypothetical protein MCEGKSH29_00202 [Candidatus Nanopelagicaceae bacterium]
MLVLANPSRMNTTQISTTQIKAGISLYCGTRLGEYFIGTHRVRIALYSDNAAGIFGALKAGLSAAEIAATYSLGAGELDGLIQELITCEFIESQTSAIQISERFISNIAEKAAKAGDHSKDASFSQIKKRLTPELTVTRWLPGVCDSGVSKVSARQSSHVEISGNSRVAQHLYATLLASGVIHTQFAASFRRGAETVSEEDLIGGYVNATDIGQVFTAISSEKSKSLALFPLPKVESAEELPAGFAEKIIKIHFGEIDPAILGLWMASGQEHLIVSEINGGYLTISPIVKPGQGPCSRCCELTIADQSGATILEGASVRDEIPVAGANYLAGLLAGQLLNLIDTGTCTLATKAISIDLLDLCNTKHITVGHHPMCGCSWR